MTTSLFPLAERTGTALMLILSDPLHVLHLPSCASEAFVKSLPDHELQRHYYYIIIIIVVVVRCVMYRFIQCSCPVLEAREHYV